MKKVSIIIPFYNCEYIDAAIESALAQTYKNIEVIVINDGSTLYTEKIKPYYGRIRYIEQGNKGTAGALNTGIANATGDYFTWLSADDFYLPHKVERQVNDLEASDRVIGYSSYVLMNEYGEVTSGSVGVSFRDRFAFLHHLRKGCAINGCTVMVQMDVLRKLNGFDETLRFTHDYDLWARIAKDHAFSYIDECLVQYRVHSEMGTQRHSEAIRTELRHVKKKVRMLLQEAYLKERMQL
ncbi:glycosyltransferase family 2 protein [Pseudalkalibacillus sp. NRS-1564]|uniref:glycosyltransferase family 2 protein n=1 Tax=Pseudalkalibacillus sp. NRS-1564 TaxID=3233900 RepID=UPI003D2E2DB8